MKERSLGSSPKRKFYRKSFIEELLQGISPNKIDLKESFQSQKTKFESVKVSEIPKKFTEYHSIQHL